MLGQLSYHDRLLQMLDMFEGMCTESEIRVIATARNELNNGVCWNITKKAGCGNALKKSRSQSRLILQLSTCWKIRPTGWFEGR